MQYMLLIYRDEAKLESFSPPERDALLEEYKVLTEGLVKSGQYKASDRLAPSSSSHCRAGARRQDADDRRAVCRDEGAAGWLLPRRGRGPRCRGRHRGAHSGRTLRLDRSTSAVAVCQRRSLTDAVAGGTRAGRGRHRSTARSPIAPASVSGGRDRRLAGIGTRPESRAWTQLRATLMHSHPTARATSVWAKSPPLNSRGSPVVLARA
jgi:hypothetical protein